LAGFLKKNPHSKYSPVLRPFVFAN